MPTTPDPVLAVHAKHARETAARHLDELIEFSAAVRPHLPDGLGLRLNGAVDSAAQATIHAARLEQAVLGTAPAASAADAASLTAADRATLSRAGVNCDVDYTGVSEEGEARARFEAAGKHGKSERVALAGVTLSAEEIAVFKRLGLDPGVVSFEGVSTEEEARRRFEAGREARSTRIR